jgi:exopolysaccharide production protein ExoY
MSWKKTASRVTRRAVDIVAGAVLLALSAPILLLGALAVLIESGRPVFFGHLRVGRNGSMYRCWKLRTMQRDAEGRLEQEPTLKQAYITNGFKLPNGSDPRVTKVGRLLRRTHIDEIPQFLNVLNGSMSLIGPRPIVRDELTWYGSNAPELLRSKPGIFGAWTSRGRTRPAYPERAELELAYVREQSLRRDFAIIVRTIPVILRGQRDA